MFLKKKLLIYFLNLVIYFDSKCLINVLFYINQTNLLTIKKKSLNDILKTIV